MPQHAFRPSSVSRFRILAAVAALIPMLCGGCNPLDWLGPNFSFNIVIPLGLATADGFINLLSSQEFQNLIGAIIGGGSAAG